MPTTLPVPSKGALRALRNLALGTSCTVAVGAGLLTEDRRRRIHTARQVYDNAQTLKSLKSSRHYHGADVLGQFEEEALRKSEDAFWLPSNVARSKTLLVPSTSTEEEPLKVDLELQNWEKPSTPLCSTFHKGTTHLQLSLGHSPLPTKHSLTPHSELVPPGPNNRFIAETLIPKMPPQRLTLQRQRRLALDIEILLDDKNQPANTNAAMSCFLGAFEQYTTVTKHGLCPELIGVTLKMFVTLGQRYDLKEKVLQVISQHGPIDEGLFQQFNPETMLGWMMKRVKGADRYADTALLKTVSSIYLTAFTSKPSISNDRMHQLGQKLCATTCEAGLYSDTIRLFARLETTRGERPISCVDHLIEACHATGKFKKNWRYFKLLYVHTSPDQVGFFKTGTLVLESLLKKDPSKLEEFLELVEKMAETNGLLASTTWFLKTLGHDWRTNRDITGTCALFERILPRISYTAHPQAVYVAMIQFCVEARREAVALEYYKRLSEAYPKASKDLKVLGHLAYMKALQGDWDGVRHYIQDIHDQKPARNNAEQMTFSTIFIPIFAIFPNSHSITQTEEFIRMAADKWQLRITSYISNIMISAYAKSKEIDSMIRWMDLTASAGCFTDASTINSVFKTLVRHCNFTFLEIYRLYHRIRELDLRLGTNSTNDDTIVLLEKIAISSSKNDNLTRHNLEVLSNFTILKSSLLDFSSSPERVYRNMVRAYVNKRFDEVLEMYSKLKTSYNSASSKHLVVACKAALKSDGGTLNAAFALIQQEQDDGLDVAHAVAEFMIYRINSLHLSQDDPQEISNMIRDDFQSLVSRNIKVPERFMTHTMSVLVDRQMYTEAIDVWDSMSSSSRKQRGPDLVTLTVLLQAYVGLRFKPGIRWVIQKLSEHQIIPDTRFRDVLTRERRRLNRQFGGEIKNGVWTIPRYSMKNYIDLIEKSLQQVRDIRVVVKEEKVIAKNTIFQFFELAAERQVASLLASPTRPVEDRPDTQAQLKETKMASVPISAWSDLEVVRTEASTAPQGRSVVAVSVWGNPRVLDIEAGIAPQGQSMAVASG